MSGGVLLPPECPLCRTAAPRTVPCPGCIARLRPAADIGGVEGLDRFRALLLYEGESARLAAGVKYGRARVAVPWMAASMVAVMTSPPVWPLGSLAAVTWVPTTAARRRARGFDQSRLLARSVARLLGVPCQSLLRRLNGPAQTGRSALERREGPALRARRRLDQATVLLVDDVVTTGATMTAASRRLREAGASEVWGLALARTPLKAPSAAVDPQRTPATHRQG